MNVDLALRLLSLLLPPAARGRYLEEWRADLEGASELGLPRRDVLAGAAALVVRIDRDHPDHSGEPRGSLPRRLARRGGCLLVAACGVLAGLYLTGGNAPEPGIGATVAEIFSIAARALAVVAIVAAGWALLLVLGAVVSARTWLTRATLLAFLVGGGLIAWGLRTGDAALPAGAAMLSAALVGAVVVAAGTLSLELRRRSAPRVRRVRTAVGGMALLTTVTVFGAIDALVWQPQAMVPGVPLGSIYTGMAERDGFDLGPAIVVMVIWALFWLAAGAVIAVIVCLPQASAFTPRRIAILMLGVVSAAVFFRFFASFGIGMSIGDSFDTGGGSGSTVSALLAYCGQLALAGSAIALGWAPRGAQPQRPLLSETLA